MPDEKHPGEKHPSETKHGTNWLSPVEKLVNPSLEFLGAKLKDKLRAWMSQKARERASLRRLQTDFVYRRIDYLGYGIEEFRTSYPPLMQEMLEQDIEAMKPALKIVINEYKIPIERAWVCLSYATDPNNDFMESGEKLLCAMSRSLLEKVIMVDSTCTLFDCVQFPASFHAQNPSASNEDIEEHMNNSLKRLSHGDAHDNVTLGPVVQSAIRNLLISVSEVYGVEFDEAKFRRLIGVGDASQEKDS
jgi:hypothetical protein